MFRGGTERRPQRVPQGFKPRYAVVQPESPSPHRRWAVPGARGRACACGGRPPDPFLSQRTNLVVATSARRCSLLRASSATGKPRLPTMHFSFRGRGRGLSRLRAGVVAHWRGVGARAAPSGARRGLRLDSLAAVINRGGHAADLACGRSHCRPHSCAARQGGAVSGEGVRTPGPSSRWRRRASRYPSVSSRDR